MPPRFRGNLTGGKPVNGHRVSFFREFLGRFSQASRDRPLTSRTNIRSRAELHHFRDASVRVRDAALRRCTAVRTGATRGCRTRALTSYVPWFAFQERTIYSFYAVVMVPWMVLAVTMCVGWLIGPPDASDRRRLAQRQPARTSAWSC